MKYLFSLILMLMLGCASQVDQEPQHNDAVDQEYTHLTVAGVIFNSSGWKFRNTFTNVVYCLADTDQLVEMVNMHKELLTKYGILFVEDCSYLALLSIKFKPQKDIMPGSTVTYYITKVHQIKTDACYHCPHAPKTKAFFK